MATGQETGAGTFAGTVEDTIKDSYLIFSIENEDYGIELTRVKEIYQMQPITRVPTMPPYIEGLLNLRGELICVIDVRKRFGKEPKEHDEETCIIVIFNEDYLLGLIVDRVEETAQIPTSQISAPPSSRLSYANQFIRNIGRVMEDVKAVDGKADDSKDERTTSSEGDVKLLIDVERFLAQE